MKLQNSNNVRALFAELGMVPAVAPKSELRLVIDEFDQWTDSSRGVQRATGFSGCDRPGLVELEAA
jgi:hypothetical protein